MDADTEFMTGLMELSYGEDVVGKLKETSSHVIWARGWPDDTVAFWNAEAFMWSRKIEKKTRDIITQDLAHLSGKNLDLGCGAFSYVKSVGFDISPKMLDFNDRCEEKIVGSVEEPLPFPDNSFDSCTAIFLLNYVNNYHQLFSEIHRLIKHEFVMVLSSSPVNEWQRQKEVTTLTLDQWKNILERFFSVTVVEKEKLLFFHCRK